MTDGICLICLKTENYLINVVGSDTNDEEILGKLKNCVPEVEWDLCFKICNDCKEELFKVYSFRHLCISSYTSLKKSVSSKLELGENIIEKDEISTDNNADDKNDIDFSDSSSKPDNIICFECFHCREVFDTKSKLGTHIKQKHKTKCKTTARRKVTCKLCGKLYTTQYRLQKHLKTCKRKNDEPNDSTETVNLNRDANNYQTIPEDLKRKTTNSIKLEENDLKVAPTCSLCGTTFCNKYLLKRHLQNVHATEKKFKCDICGSTFASPVYLNAHKRYHVGDRPHICSFCGKGFITASDLYHHEKIHANKRAYRCEICPKAFNTSSDLHKHKICVHLDRSEWKYMCTYCQRRFPLKTNLDTHLKTHTGEKNYPCHLCDRRCINKSVLMRHIETHSNIIAFKCNLCMQGYKYRKSLDIHMAKIHGIGNVKIPERIKKYFCHLCPKSYFANNKLQKHIRSHNGERPFHCSSCEKSFVDKSYIKQHLKIAHNIVNENKLEF